MRKEKANLGMSKRLLHCPFCGSAPEIVDVGSGWLHIRCTGCPARLGETWGDDETEDDLKRAWNRCANYGILISRRHMTAQSGVKLDG